MVDLAVSEEEMAASVEETMVLAEGMVASAVETTIPGRVL